MPGHIVAELQYDPPGWANSLDNWGRQVLHLMLSSAVSDSLEHIESEISERTPVASGGTKGSLRREVRYGDPVVYGSVYSLAETTVYVEYGRRPGRPPPTSALEAWCERVLGDASLAFIVARAIGRRGLRGFHMFRDGFNASRPWVLDRLQRAVTRSVDSIGTRK